MEITEVAELEAQVTKFYTNESDKEYEQIKLVSGDVENNNPTLPTKFKILVSSIEYEIIEVDSNNTYLSKFNTDGEVCFGSTYPFEQVIVINKDLPPTRKFRVLIHEITHAFIQEYGFINRMFDEEEMCEFMSVYGHEIIVIAQAFINRNNMG